MMRSLLVAVLLVAAAAGAQQLPTDVPKMIRGVPGAPPVQAGIPFVVQYAADSTYERWWREISSCEGLPLPPQHTGVRFYGVNAIHFVDLLRPNYAYDTVAKVIVLYWAVAMSYLDDESIFVALPYLRTESTVKHEMLHHLMRWAGEKSGHPSDRFTRCGIEIQYTGKI